MNSGSRSAGPGATKLQYLALGKGTRQHALIAGKTGSGKSTLFHVIITNLRVVGRSGSRWEFYLIDFKKGSSSSATRPAGFPTPASSRSRATGSSASACSSGSERELRRRGEMFRQLGAQDIAGYSGRAARSHAAKTSF